MYRLIATACLTLLLVSCGHAQREVRDPPYVEQLRGRISKVRHALAETRRTIALSQGAPYLPELYVRLAELTSEEAKYHYQVAYEREQRSTKALHVPQVRLLKEQAISTYHMVLRRFPTTPLGPRILFNVGHEYRELGDYEDMQKTLEELAAKYPNHDLSAEGLLVLGDYKFDQSKLDDAEAYYNKILAGPESRVTGLADYKLAWVQVNRGNCKKALGSFEQAILAARHVAKKAAAHANGSDQDIDVRREALVDLTYCYSLERKPAQAVPYLRKMAYSRAAYVAALEKLASRYSIMNQSVGAADVGRQLLLLAPDSADRLDDARMLYGALKRSRRYFRIGSDLRLIMRTAIRGAHSPGRSQASTKRLLEEFEAYARDLATRAQKRSMRKRSTAAFKAQVALAYTSYLNAFPDSKERPQMLLNLADMESELSRYLSAGRHYLEAAPLLGKVPEPEPEPKKESAKASKLVKGKKKHVKTEAEKARDRKKAIARGKEDHANALYDAVVALQTSLEKASTQTHIQRVVARAGLRRGGTELLALSTSAGRSRRVKFAIAKTLYDAGRYREAIDLLNAIAYEYRGTIEARAAVHMVLDSYNTLNEFGALMAAGHRFLGPDSPADTKLRAEIKPIVVAAEQRQLDELSLKAAGDEGGGLAELEGFAARYEGTELGERALLNTFVAARAAGDSEALYRIGEEISKKYPKSEQLPGVLSTLARTAAARFEFDRSIDFFRKAAVANPAEKVTLLVAAGQLEEELANSKTAEALYREALASTTGDAKQGPAAALAGLMEKKGDAKLTVRQLAPLAKDGGPEVLARLGLAQLVLGQPDAAESSLSGVLNPTSGASPEATARAHYGMAEVLNTALEGYRVTGDIEGIQEFIALVEVTEQSYLNAARQGSPLYTAVALARYAHMAASSAQRFKSMQVPPGLSPEESKQVQSAFNSRATDLEAQAKQALDACSEQAWSGHAFNVGARWCLSAKLPTSPEVPVESLAPRSATAIPGLEELRKILSRNPEDLDALRELGTKLLAGGDPHAARLVFAKASQSGGGPLETNLLGVASWKAGDRTGGLEAFAQAAEAGLEAGRQNLVTGLRSMGLGEAAEVALKKFAAGEGGGLLLVAGSAPGPAQGGMK